MAADNKPFPWNPRGFIPPGIEHLFVAKPDREPARTTTPTPASKFTIGKRSDPARTTKMMRASI